MKDQEMVWDELQNAILGLFEYGSSYSKDIKISFGRQSINCENNNEISIFTEDIDNIYGTDETLVTLENETDNESESEDDALRWEIFLHKDGTWTIA